MLIASKIKAIGLYRTKARNLVALSRAIVETHGGRIFVEDSPLGGASFVVELPAAEPIVQVRASGVSLRLEDAPTLFVVATALPATYSVPIGRKSVTTGLRVDDVLGKSTRTLKQMTSPLRNAVSAAGSARRTEKPPRSRARGG